MKNIGILGFGTVGRATYKHLKNKDRTLVVFDKRQNIADAVNRENKVNADVVLDGLVICINVLPPVAVARREEYAQSVARELLDAIHACNVRLGEAAPILVRSTVPPGTCDILETAYYPNHAVMAWPEFSKEESMRKGYEIKAHVVGLSPRFCDKDEGADRVKAFTVLEHSELHGAVIQTSTEVFPNVQAEFVKIAYNVRRAADVTTFNELARGAAALGIEPVDAEFLLEVHADPAKPSFATAAFGGKCLGKDLWTWDNVAQSNFGYNIEQINLSGLRGALKMAVHAQTLMGLEERPVVFLGLQDGPSSGSASRSPAYRMLGLSKWKTPPVCVDSQKKVREHFQWLLDMSHRTHVTVTDPESEALLHINTIVIAQKSRDKVMWLSLMKVLKTSEAPVKLVINACHMQFGDWQIIEAQKWGAVFVDAIELRRMDAENVKAAASMTGKPEQSFVPGMKVRHGIGPFLSGSLAGA